MTIGGTVLFKKLNNKIIESIILQIFRHLETTIEMFSLNIENTIVGIFKVTIPPELSRRHFMNIGDSIKPPNVLIIKFVGNPITRELENEIDIHKHFGAQDNIMPFCPSYLLHQKIKSEREPMTLLGILFYQLLQYQHKPSDFYNELESLWGYDIYIKMKKKIKVQHIIIMEFLDCSTLSKLKRNLPSPPYIHNLHGKEIQLNNYDEMVIFYTYFLATLMALENYSHGDLHLGNMLICFNNETTPPTIIPQLIDFGRSTTIDDLKFKKISFFRYSWKKYIFIKNIYNEALKNKDSIVSYIKENINSNNYIEAIIIMSMCCDKKNRITSMFNYTFIPSYKYDGYLHIYKIDESLAKTYNGWIKELIEKRKTLKSNLESAARAIPLNSEPLPRLPSPRKSPKLSPKASSPKASSPKASPPKASPPKASPKTSPKPSPRKSPKSSPTKSPKASPPKASPPKASSKASPPKASSKASFRTSLTRLLTSLKLPVRTAKSVHVGGIRKSKGKNTRKKQTLK
jgi:hypothetical protein